jgi:Enolase C-terminal domain-like
MFFRPTPQGALALRGFCKRRHYVKPIHIPLSAHTAPAVDMHLGCAATPVRHLEYFHDHVRIESMFFDGVPAPANGALAPDLSRAGLGIELKRADAKRFAA